jgi:ABC-type antimicrobial peptide transport system permease subunit
VHSAEHNKRIAGASQRLGAIAVGVLAATSFLLAMLCLYGLMVGAVTARLRELGVRIALGATSRALVTLFCQDILLVVVAGVFVGTVLVSYTGAVLRSLLVGVELADPLTLLITGVTLIGFAGFTMVVPIIRASRMIPQALLREH